MNNAGLSTSYEEGDKGQFEVFESQQGRWPSFLKAGHGKFITLSQIERRLISGH
tara:strand:+ start:459 stop:620 length:162 start_codon:yes stop_codon:yes gene_type:complete